MALTYTFKDQYGLYFVTCTVHQWVDVFTRSKYIDILLNSLKHCQEEKGLQIYAWVVMTNHIHLIVSSEGEQLSDIFRDFKKYTSKKIFEAIEKDETESRRSWLCWLLKKDESITFWQEGYHAEEILTEKFCETKVSYIHANPVKAGIVEKEEEYLLSSCADFYGVRDGPLKLSPLG